MAKKIYITVFMALLLVSFKPVVVAWEKMSIDKAAEELKDMQAAYAKITNYSVKINYNTFDTKSSGGIHDKSNGYYIKSGIYSKSRLLGIFSIQNEKLRITIDSSKKVIQVSNAFEFKDPGFSLNDYIKILGICKTVKKSKENNRLGYRFETNNKIGIVAQEIFLQNGITKEVNVYYANEHFLRDDHGVKKEIVYPRLQVMFYDFDQKIKLTKEDFSTDGIITIDRDKKLKIDAGYKGFKLIDGRVKK